MRFTDSIWERIRSNDTSKIPNFVSETASELPEQPEFDVTVCGGTLGIFLATSLQLKGLKVCVVERGPLAGRAQEWNISRSELKALVSLGVLTDEEIEQAIAVEFNPVRMQFKARSSHQKPHHIHIYRLRTKLSPSTCRAQQPHICPIQLLSNP